MIYIWVIYHSPLLDCIISGTAYFSTYMILNLPSWSFYQWLKMYLFAADA